MPTYAEMLDLFGVRSKSVVHYWIEKLLEKGTLEKDANGFLKLCACPLAFRWLAM